ncbi:hypothetical protein TUM20985_14890 [Mycobacterium antarcticum]|uniref:hypothetical protein n=1 Tax=Mycolicibacterium sp. TUM20985 TaxID=3023370 RepID=UPI0025724D99|nr:hypothetical protein [Mycolicibacterium sp. TUM20985]BDX30942.1 hypothetical protein TUM20985_14890 [Mycolicibacterium sp. TUM20985]
MGDRSLSETVRDGDSIASLQAIRDQIAVDIDLCGSMRDKAALYLRLADVIGRIDELKPLDAKGDAIDEIAARRADRRSGTAPRSPRTNRSG